MARETEQALRQLVQELEGRLDHAGEKLRALSDGEEPRRLLAQAQAERQRFYDILESLPVMVCVLTPDRHIPFANRRFRETFGDPNGSHCYETVANLSGPCAQCQAFIPFETQAEHHWEFTGADGFCLDVYSLPFTDVDGSPLILEVDLDITERKRAEAELAEHRERLEDLVRERTVQLEAANAQLQAEIAERRQVEDALEKARDQAEAANRAKGIFLANMSHELRTPLNTILGFSHLLREHSESDEQRRDLDTINRSGEHLLGLINDVLDVAKIEAGRMVLEISPCDLKGLVRGVIEMMHGRAAEKRLTLSLVEGPGIPEYVRTDSARLRQALINLIGNAIQYTESGSITVRLDARPADDEGGLVLTFQVEDTGIGIAAQDQARIFDAFIQVGNARQQKGTGLGLAITRQFIQWMGGSIQVKSRPGEGSRFLVELPVEPAQAREIKAAPTEQGRILGLEAGQTNCRVLVVDDERENWLLLERLLQNAGFHTEVAENGRQAVEKFQAWHPHFIWMDLRMPVMDGLEATRRIRELEGGREVRIVAVTAASSIRERGEVRAAGLDHYVLKPYRPGEIFDCMAQQLGVRYRRAPAVPPQEQLRCPDLKMADMAALPADLCADLRRALESLNVSRISEAIERVAGRNDSLGAALKERAGRFAFTEMLNAVEAAQGQAGA